MNIFLLHLMLAFFGFLFSQGCNKIEPQAVKNETGNETNGSVRQYRNIKSSGHSIPGLEFWIRDDVQLKSSVEVAVTHSSGKTIIGLSFELVHPSGSVVSTQVTKIPSLASGKMLIVCVKLSMSPTLAIGDSTSAFGNAPADYPYVRVMAGKCK